MQLSHRRIWLSSQALQPFTQQFCLWGTNWMQATDTELRGIDRFWMGLKERASSPASQPLFKGMPGQCMNTGYLSPVRGTKILPIWVKKKKKKKAKETELCISKQLNPSLSSASIRAETLRTDSSHLTALPSCWNTLLVHPSWEQRGVSLGWHARYIHACCYGGQSHVVSTQQLHLDASSPGETRASAAIPLLISLMVE